MLDGFRYWLAKIFGKRVEADNPFLKYSGWILFGRLWFDRNEKE